MKSLETLILLCIYYMHISGVLGVGLSIHGPDHIMVGETATLECIVPTEVLEIALSVEWRFREVDVTATPELIYQYRLFPNKLRYFPPHVDFLNQSVLPETAISIPNASVDRNGRYSCYVDTDDGTLDIEKKLAVIELPKANFTTSFDDDDVLSVGEEIDINCTVKDGHPKPDVYWVLNDNKIDIEDTVTEEADRSVLLKSTLKIEESHLGKTLGCHAKVISNQDKEYIVKSESSYLNNSRRVVISTALMTLMVLICALLVST